MHVVGRKFTHSQFKSYLAGLAFTPWAKFVVVHNTSSPDLALYKTWEARQGKYANWSPEQWLKNLASYYAGQGWSGGPHLCIPPTPDTILVLNDLAYPGVHTPSWNKNSYGVETVGEFEREAVPDSTRDNLVAALGIMHQHFNLDPASYQLGVRGLHFHKEDHATTHKSCPGKNLDKARLVSDVLRFMNPSASPSPAPVEQPHAHDVPISSQEADTSRLNTVELISTYWLQAALNLWRPSLKLAVNGDPKSPATVEAVKIFQLSQSLTVDGVAGGVTRVALKRATAV